jgi:hypothetical protein
LHNRKVFTVKLDKEMGSGYSLGVDDFDALVDAGFDDILILTPRTRYVATIDDWLDYSYIDLEGDAEVRTLHKAFMG